MIPSTQMQMESVFRQQLEKQLFQNTTLCIFECLNSNTEMEGENYKLMCKCSKGGHQISRRKGLGT